MKILPTIFQNKSSGVNKLVPGLVIRKVSSINCVKAIWTLLLAELMDITIRMRVIYNAKYRYATHLKFGGKFLTSLTKLVLEAKSRICSTIKKNHRLHCRKFSAFAVAVII